MHQEGALGREMSLLAHNSVVGCKRPVVMTCDEKPNLAQHPWAVSLCWLGRSANAHSSGQNKDSS